MQMNRTRPRTDRFELRGWTYPFHELRDQGRMAALVADTDETQWLQLTGWRYPVEIRPGDLDLIFPQIGWPLPGKRKALASLSAENAAAALDQAEAAISRLKDATREPAPVSSIDDVVEAARNSRPDLFSNTTTGPSPALRILFLPDEEIAAAVSRLTPALRLEFDEVNNLVLDHAGARRLESGKTAQQRFDELSALLDELAELGAQAERA